jgi:hypothetical protein
MSGRTYAKLMFWLVVFSGASVAIVLGSKN